MRVARLVIVFWVVIFTFSLGGCEAEEEEAITPGGPATDGDGQDEPENEIPEGFPDELPFELSRPDAGAPLTTEEITAFSKKMTAFWAETGYFNWVWWTSHGMDASYDSNMPDYKLWWQDTSSAKDGDTITFTHYGGADNLSLRTAKVINQAISGYLMSGDEMFGRLVEQYCKGFVALSNGMEWGDENPVVPYIQARAIFTRDHSYTMEGGRKVTVDYGPVKVEKEDWNAHTINNPDNPYWGDIWVRTMRSKDDVPHMFRSYPLIQRVAEDGKDEYVREAAEKALEYLKGFAKDIVDLEYFIRTKDKDGNAIIPKNENGSVKDLASFVQYETGIPNAECNAKLVSALVAYSEPLENDCEYGFGGMYETFATGNHYFNHAIIRFFHIAAITNALMTRQNDVAYQLLEGLIQRADKTVSDEDGPVNHRPWNSDMASFLLAAATAGLPLTSEEARIIQEQYSTAADHYKKFAYWDPWDESVPNGEFSYKPNREGPTDPEDPDSPTVTYVRPTEVAYLMEYCFSPFRNEAGAEFVDCDIIKDVAHWGEEE